MEETTTNCAVRIIIRDEEENYLFTSSDMAEIKKHLPLQSNGAGFLKKGEQFQIMNNNYEVTNIVLDYYTEMVTDPESFYDHSGNYNPWNMEVFISAKRL